MKKSILIIDDNGLNAENYGEILEGLGYSYHWIDLPLIAAEEKDLHSKFSHVFVDFDFGLDDVNGENVGHLLRSNWELMPLILLSAWIHDIGSAEMYGRVGWDALLSKKTIEESGNVDQLFSQKLVEAKLNADIRVDKNYPVNQERIDVITRRLNALEKAFKANGGRISGSCSDKEALQAACIFLSKEDQEELTKDDITNLQEYRSKSPYPDYKAFWKERNVDMTTPNAWYPYFRAREEVPTGEKGKLAKEGMCARQVLLKNPHLWLEARKRFKHLSDLIKEYGISG